MRLAGRLVASFALVVVANTAHASPFATTVESFTQGSNANTAFGDPNTALGPPALDTGFGDVTPFNAPFSPNQLVSIAPGGELIVSFGHRVFDDSRNPMGIDLLIFGNAFFFDPSFAPIANDIFAEPGQISVSQDGSTWFEITSVSADDLFPTLGFLDTTGPFASDGTVPADFTKPVDPSIEWLGKGFEEIVPLYGGSGGGTGVDISETGLPWIQFVRISQDPNDFFSTEIDAFSEVTPDPPQLQTKDQQRCMVALNKSFSKVAKVKGTHIFKCIRDGSKGKLGDQSIEECTATDPQSVAKAKAKTIDLLAKRCAGAPAVVGSGADVVNQVAIDKEHSLIRWILGADLDAVVVAKTDPEILNAKKTAKCQVAVVKAAKKCQDAKLKAFNKCGKDGLKGKIPPGLITDAVDLEVRCLQADPNDPSLPEQSDPEGKIARICMEKFDQSIAKKCASPVDLDVAFPGSSLGTSLMDLRDYVVDMVDCEVCLAINVIDGVRRDCDLFDDGMANGTCL